MYVLIVDDEPLARGRLTHLVKELDGYSVVGEAANGDEAIAAVEELDPDLVLMDIKMPGKDGMEAAMHISQMQDPPGIIFCTAYEEFALEAFNTLAIGYLLKPVQREDLESVLLKAKKLTKVHQYVLKGSDGNTRQHISTKTHQGISLIPVDSILCFVADQKYVSIITADAEILIDETLKELEQEFAGKFMRIHRNSLVALEYIEGLIRNVDGRYEVKLKSSQYRPTISRRHVSEVKKLLSQL